MNQNYLFTLKKIHANLQGSMKISFKKELGKNCKSINASEKITNTLENNEQGKQEILIKFSQKLNLAEVVFQFYKGKQ